MFDITMTVGCLAMINAWIYVVISNKFIKKYNDHEKHIEQLIMRSIYILGSFWIFLYIVGRLDENVLVFYILTFVFIWPINRIYRKVFKIPD